MSEIEVRKSTLSNTPLPGAPTRTPRFGVWLSLAFLLFLLLASVAPGWIAPYDPNAIAARDAFRAPSLAHIFGTDESGRDVFSRVVAGTGTSLLIGVSATAIGLALGLVLGVLASFGGRILDFTVNRVVEMLFAFPGLLLALLIIVIYGPGPVTATLAVGLSTAPGYARIIRGQLLSIRRSAYVESARVLSHRPARILLQHILPNSLAPLLVLATLGVGQAIVWAAALSFLGLGAQPPAAEWGAMLSGGLRQRALIAAALALGPPLLIADEPTTALDVSIQARILGVLAEIKAQGTGLLLISHDLAVVSSIADHVLVMRDGRVVEQGTTDAVLGSPAHDYTRALIAAVPSDKPRGTPLSLDAPAPALPHPAPGELVLEARGISKSFRVPGGRLQAVDEVSFQVRRGETLGLVGESGSGKSTVARILLALERADAGTVELNGDPWSGLTERARRPLRRRIGAIYQDSLSSFDPRWSVARILSDAAGGPSSVPALLAQVGLDPALGSRRPLTLSGGQRQRVSIARALAASPEVLICDEPVSALDVTVQAQVLDLLDRLQRERGIAYIFISHDLAVVRHMSDRVAVMQGGRLVEQGDTETVFASPAHPYTAQLIADSPPPRRPQLVTARPVIEEAPSAASRRLEILPSLQHSGTTKRPR